MCPAVAKRRHHDLGDSKTLMGLLIDSSFLSPWYLAYQRGQGAIVRRKPGYPTVDLVQVEEAGWTEVGDVKHELTDEFIMVLLQQIDAWREMLVTDLSYMAQKSVGTVAFSLKRNMWGQRQLPKTPNQRSPQNHGLEGRA